MRRACFCACFYLKRHFRNASRSAKKQGKNKSGRIEDFNRIAEIFQGVSAPSRNLTVGSELLAQNTGLQAGQPTS
jgi:hypothetical protein